MFDHGSAVVGGLTKGKYAVGFESTHPMPNGKSLTVGRDTLAERNQFKGTSFVSFGQDSTWYLIDDLPMMTLNFGQLGFTAGSNNPCQVVGIEKEKEKLKFKVYPNPTNGIFQLEGGQEIKEVQVFNMRGQLVLTKERNTSKVNLEGEVRGLYLLRVQFKNGTLKSEKIILE
ncbi:MAG: T9SS type A sorting domain-containing protein [Flavobacteriales bacterium]|nr:T9SS type A sorting domain-containing protein [Flavobacteriales bacterium]